MSAVFRVNSKSEQIDLWQWANCQRPSSHQGSQWKRCPVWTTVPRSSAPGQKQWAVRQTDGRTDRGTEWGSPLLVALSVSTAEALAQGRRNDCSLPVIKKKAKLIYQTSVLNIKCLFVLHMSDSGMLSGWLFFLLFSQMMALDPKQDTRLTSNRPVATVPFQNCLNERLNFIFGLEVAEVEQPLTEVPN